MPNDPFSAIAAAFYKPKLQAVGVNDQGQYVDASGAPTTEFDQPGMFQRAFNPYAQEIQNLNAQGQANPLRMQQQAIGQRLAAMKLDPTLTNETYAQTYNPLFSPQNRNAQTQAASFGSTGAPSIIGSNTGMTDINNSKLMLQNSQGALGRNNIINASLDAEAANSLSKEVNVEPMVIQHTINQLRATLGQDPTESQILESVNAARLATAKQTQADLPISTGTQHLQTIGQNYLSQYMPDELATTPFVNRVTGSGVMPSHGILSAGYRSPAMVSMASLGRMGQNGIVPPTTVPSGKVYPKPVMTDNGLVSPVTGTGYSPEDVEERADKHNDAVDDQHDAKQATIASQIAHLKAIQAQLQAQHSRSGILPMMGNNLVGNMHSLLDPVGHAIKRGYNATSNALIGQ